MGLINMSPMGDAWETFVLDLNRADQMRPSGPFSGHPGAKVAVRLAALTRAKVIGFRLLRSVCYSL
jgi:hypothetical protein